MKGETSFVISASRNLGLGDLKELGGLTGSIRE